MTAHHDAVVRGHRQREALLARGTSRDGESALGVAEGLVAVDAGSLAGRAGGRGREIGESGVVGLRAGEVVGEGGWGDGDC